MSDTLTITLRSIQHYMYCPRRYALLELNRDWSENAFVVKAILLHDGSHRFSDSKKIVRSDVAVFRDDPDYDLSGVAYSLRTPNDTEIPGRFAAQKRQNMNKLWTKLTDLSELSAHVGE